MSDAARAFRDYATRVSFNMSLSRNQVGHLAGIVADIENEILRLEWKARCDLREETITDAGGRPNMFVVGRGSLHRMGLVEHDPRWVKEEEEHNAARAAGVRRLNKYNGPMYRLTPAGEHVVELLRIAGLIQKAAVNTNVKKKRRAS